MSAIWLHDGMWIPKEVSANLIVDAERAMLHTLQLDNHDNPPLFRIRELATEAAELIRTLGDPSTASGAHGIPLNESDRMNIGEPPSTRPIRWNTQAQTSGYRTFVERSAKRRRKSYSLDSSISERRS